MVLEDETSISEVSQTLQALSSVLLALSHGLSKRVDEDFKIEDLLRRHEALRLTVCTQLAPGDFGDDAGSPSGNEMQSVDRTAVWNMIADKNRSPDKVDDESKDANEFAVAYERYLECKDQLAQKIKRVGMSNETAESQMDDCTKEEEVAMNRLRELEEQAREKNVMIKQCIDKLRQLQIDLSVVEVDSEHS